MKKNDVKIHYIAEMIPDTPEGIILEAVIGGMAAYYSEQMSQNIRRGQRASRRAQAAIGPWDTRQVKIKSLSSTRKPLQQ